MTTPSPPDGWVQCGCGARHWGRYGAAGLLLSDGGRIVLQHRAPWSHHGGTWALPGGALRRDENAWQGALREAEEEAGIDEAAVTPVATSVLRHPDWSYTTVLARARGALGVSATDAESVAVSWVPIGEVDQRELLPAFADGWPTLRSMLAIDAHVVVDAANVVGSRPDGWWKDRRGAAQRLVERLDLLAAAGVPAALLGLPGERWWPDWTVVTEGAARGAAGTGRVGVVPASGSGDDTIVDVTRSLAAGTVAVVTADRGLASRVRDAGAAVVRPRALLELLDDSR